MVWHHNCRTAVRLVVLSGVGAVLLEMSLQVMRALDIAIGRIQFGAAQFLQVGRLCVDKELVDGRDFEVFDQPQVDTHTYTGEKLHRLFAADCLG